MLARLSQGEALNTGEFKILVTDLASQKAALEERHAKAVRNKWIWGIAGVIVAGIVAKGTWWIMDAGADKAKTAITKDLAEKVDVQNTANNDAHGVLTKSIGEVKTDLADKGDLLDALYQVQIEGVRPTVAKTKVARQRAARKAAQPKDNP
jgi:hypothetical protein